MAMRRLASPSGASDTAPAAYLHQVYGDHYWRLPGGLLRGLVGSIIWPLALPFALGLYTARSGFAVRERTGKSIVRQLGEQALIAARHSIAPYWYYMFELHDDERRAVAHLYLQRHETKGPAYSLLQPPPETDAMADKVWFARRCRSAGIAAVPVLLVASAGEVTTPDGASPVLPEADLFVKPRRGRGGRNTERWDWAGAGTYRSSKGEVVRSAELMRLLSQQSLKRDYIVQPRLTNHPMLADLSNGALATVRVLTCRNELGQFEATDAAFRMAIGTNTVVDNFHAGGIAANVDMATGELGPASDMGLTPKVGWRESHPISGAAIRGRRLPLWDEVIELACRAHAAFPERAIIGWDIGILAKAPCIVEGNIKPDLDIHQRVARRPLGAGRAAALLAFNLRNVLLRSS
jgi:hypothetical protein